MDLLGGDDSESEVSFQINENYAKRYDNWRKGEELQKLKDKYGDVSKLETDSSSSEEEDEDAVELTEDVEIQFLKTLSCLKEKNPKIYDQNHKFFEENKPSEASKEEPKVKKKKSTPLSVAAYQRKMILENGGHLSDEEKFSELTPVEQEQAIKDSFKDVMKTNDSEDEAGKDWGGMFKKRTKTDQETKEEESLYKEWLAGQRESLDDAAQEKELKGLHEFWNNPRLNEGEQFLKDYILKKRFLDEDKGDRIPMYDELIHGSDSDLSQDEETLKKQEEFEHKYNFRFEEPDQDFIKRYPRTMENSMRKKDERRKKHRDEVKVRKQAERAKKDEELKRLKALKKSEILDKIKRLQDITGNADMGFKSQDVDDEFDPEEHDRRMSELFNEDYYGAEAEEKKPECPDIDEELEIENWDEWGGDEEHIAQNLHCEDPDFNMDCDYDPDISKKGHQQELIESTKNRRGKRRQSKFAAAVGKKKPVFDPKDKTFEKYLDEYYSLDYEDIIGDIPCRFKYRKVVPNDYGLSIEEILAAPDKELNSWASVKKIMQRRPEHVELYDVKAYKRKALNMDKKMKCLPTLYTDNKDDEELKPSKKKKKHLISSEDIQEDIMDMTQSPGNSKEQRIKKRKNKGDAVKKGTEPNRTNETIHKDNSGTKKRKRSESVIRQLGESDGTGGKGINKKKLKLQQKSILTKTKKTKKSRDAVDIVTESTERAPNKIKKKQGQVKAFELSNGISTGKVGTETKKRKKAKKNANQNIETMKRTEEIRLKKKIKKNERFQKAKQRETGKKPLNSKTNALLQLSDERLKSYGLNPKKFKNKLKYGSMHQSE